MGSSREGCGAVGAGRSKLVPVNARRAEKPGVGGCTGAKAGVLALHSPLPQGPLMGQAYF